MRHDATDPIDNGTGRPFERAEFALDMRRGSIVAANEHARHLLGIGDPSNEPVALDGAMPALARLKALNGSADHHSETLAFWLRGKVLKLDCDIKLEQGSRPEEPLYRLSCRLPSGFPFEIEPPRQHRDDAQTLKEIARRIRSGTTAVATDGELARDLEPEQPVPIPLVPAETAELTPDPLTPGDLAKLAHELRTPLAAIAAASEIIRDEQLGALGNTTYLGYAADIHESATHALSVVSSLLKKPANGAGEPQLDLATLDLNAVVSATVSSLQAVAHQRGISLTFSPEHGRPAVNGNATAIRQILINLVTNAVKFTPTGGDIRTVTGYLPNGGVFLVVSDSGSGFSLQKQNSQYQENAQGLGIGLPLVSELAGAMNATVDIDTTPERGTTVTIAFPPPGGRR